MLKNKNCLLIFFIEELYFTRKLFIFDISFLTVLCETFRKLDISSKDIFLFNNLFISLLSRVFIISPNPTILILYEKSPKSGDLGDGLRLIPPCGSFSCLF